MDEGLDEDRLDKLDIEDTEDDDMLEKEELLTELLELEELLDELIS